MSQDSTSEAGLGLVEVIVAMTLLALIAVAILPALWQGIILSSKQSSTATATRHLNSLIEEARESPTCPTIASIRAARTVTDGKGATLTSSGTPGGCASGTTVTVELFVRDVSSTTLASTRALVYIP